MPSMTYLSEDNLQRVLYNVSSTIRNLLRMVQLELAFSSVLHQFQGVAQLKLFRVALENVCAI